jgi:hypothetical protein
VILTPWGSRWCNLSTGKPRDIYDIMQIYLFMHKSGCCFREMIHASCSGDLGTSFRVTDPGVDVWLQIAAHVRRSLSRVGWRIRSDQMDVETANILPWTGILCGRLGSRDKLLQHTLQQSFTYLPHRASSETLLDMVQASPRCLGKTSSPLALVMQSTVHRRASRRRRVGRHGWHSRKRHCCTSAAQQLQTSFASSQTFHLCFYNFSNIILTFTAPGSAFIDHRK